MANGVNTSNDRVFEYLQSAEPDLTFVADEHMLPEDIQTVTDEDRKTWKNFSDRLGSLDQFQKRHLKDLWIEGGRPTIKIEKKDSKNTASGDKNRAWYGRWENPKAETRDILHLYEHDLVADFMGEISHGRQYVRKPGESVDDWKARRNKQSEEMKKQVKDFEEDRYGGLDWDVNLGEKNEGKIKKWFPYMGTSRTYRIGKVDGKEVAVDDEGNVYPDMEVPPWEEHGSSRSRSLAWAYNQPERALYDPEKRKGWNEQRGEWIKPTQEFEAHKIIEDSLWGDYESRFGKEWRERGTGWLGMDWRSDEGYDPSNNEHIQDLIDKGLVE